MLCYEIISIGDCFGSYRLTITRYYWVITRCAKYEFSILYCIILKRVCKTKITSASYKKQTNKRFTLNRLVWTPRYSSSWKVFQQKTIMFLLILFYAFQTLHCRAEYADIVHLVNVSRFGCQHQCYRSLRWSTASRSHCKEFSLVKSYNYNKYNLRNKTKFRYKNSKCGFLDRHANFVGPKLARYSRQHSQTFASHRSALLLAPANSVRGCWYLRSS